MSKQSSSKMKIALASLLVVFFVAAVAAPALGAYQLHNNASSSSSIGNKGLQSFNTEQLAKQHCPSDTVVWLNLNTGIYHLKGEHWYGTLRMALMFVRKRPIKQETEQHGNIVLLKKLKHSEFDESQFLARGSYDIYAIC